MRNLFSFLMIVLITFFSFPSAAKKVNDESAQLRATINDQMKDQVRIRLAPPASGMGLSRCYLKFGDIFSEGFVAQEDAIRMDSYSPYEPNIYTLLHANGTTALADQGLPMKNNRRIKLGFSVPTASTYTFLIEVLKITDLKSAVLVDHSANDTMIDLLQPPSSYSFTTARDSVNETRFSLLINAPTAPTAANAPTTPMIVAGDMRISGALRSEGEVHLYADTIGPSIGKIDIDDTDSNTMLITDTIIFYSNDRNDGLLRNQNKKGGGVKGKGNDLADSIPKNVILRKDFGTDENHRYLSIPFDATVIAGGQTYCVYEFDGENRADSSSSADSVIWKSVITGTGLYHDETSADTTQLVKANGYLISVTQGRVLDFVSRNRLDIDTLFAADKDKPRRYLSYGAAEGKWSDQRGDGWAFIGGLHSTSYKVTRELINPDVNTIYYRLAETSQAIGSKQETGFREIILDCGEDTILGPYTPFYIHGKSSPGTSQMNTFIFYKKGVDDLSLESVNLRSSNDNAIKDQLRFVLSSDKNGSYDRFYLNFTDGYAESFRVIEDAVKMSTVYGNKPATYSLLDGNDLELVVNGLPMKDEREVGMGFSVPESGDYTLSLDAQHQQDVRNVILLDKVTGKKIDLLQFPYSFNTSSVENENGRFALFINSSYTGTPSIAAGLPYAYAKDNLLTVKNLLEGNTVQVFDLTGRLIVSGKVSGTEFSTALSQKGVYIVNVKGEKTTVLKVLNN